MNTIFILGTQYSLVTVDYGEDPEMGENIVGYCDSNRKRIAILNLRSTKEWKNTENVILAKMEKETIRHEIIHAFLDESGLQGSSSECQHWACNEEMIDWFALQAPKILDAFKAACAI